MNNQIVRLWPVQEPVYWAGKYSTFKHGGAIERCIVSWLNHHQPTRKLVIPAIDGFVAYPPTLVQDTTGIRVLDFSKDDSKLAAYSEHKEDMFGILCSRNVKADNVLYLPLDDDIFERGLTAVLPQPPPWDSRKSTVFWRGGFSGHPFIRGDVVQALHGKPNTDVKLIPRWQWNHPVPQDHLAPEAPIETYMQHKYILIIDGGVIASSHQWVLGSGAVPIFVTHPENEWWCKKWLIDGYNCILVGYDMDLLKQKIQWLVENDDAAESIAFNARALAVTLFTPQFQKKVLEDELSALLV